MSSPSAIEFRLPTLTVPQGQICAIDARPERCWDVEGSARSAKSWGIGFWIRQLAFTYPGIQIFYCRYKDEGLIALRDIWAKVSVYFPPEFQAHWNSEDQSWDFNNGEWIGEVYTGSRVFLSSLKVSEASDSAAIHGKYKSKTIAVVIIEEAQEVPKANYIGLKERLSQSRTPDGKPFDYPLKIVLVHNAVDDDHWIAKEFPLNGEGRCTKPGHAHIRADVYSNAGNLGPNVMAGYEQDYPDGHPLRRTMIEGKRGPVSAGTPVYGVIFKRPLHVRDTVERQQFYPLLEGWDFGSEKPAVVWAQYLRHIARLQVLAAVKGSELFLEQFAPKVLEIRRRLFGRDEDLNIRSWCDPTGAVGNHGMQYTAVAHLHDLNVFAQPAKATEGHKDANDAEVRDKAIQTVGGYLLRMAVDGQPAFLMHPRCILVDRNKAGQLEERESNLMVTAFEAGYIWSDKAASDDKPNIRRPKKGTNYDDLMNALEYIVTGEQIPAAPSVAMLAQATAQYQTAPEREILKRQLEQARLLRQQQRDRDPSDRRLRMGGGRRGIM